MSTVADMEVKVTADIRDLQRKMQEAGGVTEGFAKKAKVSFGDLGSSVSQSLRGVASNMAQTAGASNELGNAIGGITSSSTILVAGIGIAAIAIYKLVTAETEAQKAAKALKADTEKFHEALKKTESSALSTGIQLKAFVDIARDGNKPLVDRNEALLQANKILGTHGEKLTLVNINTAAVTKQVELFTQALINQAIAAKYADRAADLFIQQRDAAKSYGTELDKLNKLEASLSGKHPDSFTQAERFRKLEIDAQRDKVINLASAYKGVTKELGNVSGSLSEVQAKATGAFGALGTKTKDIPNIKVKPKKITIEKPDKLEFVKGITEDFTTKPIQFNNAAEILAGGLPTRPTAPTISPYQQWLDDVVLTNEKLKEQVAIVQETLLPVFNSFVDAVIQGNQKIGDVFSAALKGIIAQLIKAAALAAILSLISGGASGAKGGFNFLTGLKGILKGKVPGFAGGVQNFAGGLAVVGERGPELVNLPRGSNVIPNKSLANVNSPIHVTVAGSFRGQGSELLYVIDQATARRGRNG